MAAVGLYACGDNKAASNDDASTSVTTSSSGGGGQGAGTTGTAGSGAAGAGGSEQVALDATLQDLEFRCKLLSGAFLEDPTENAVQTRFNLKGSDLGIPLLLGSDLHLFFGDSVGYKLIWDFGEDPDAVARLPLASVQSDATSVCRELAFYVTNDVPSVANGVDAAIARDFAGASMTPPAGQPIEDYIAQAAGPFANLPGTFEVPSGGLAQGGKAYLFYTGQVELAPKTRATLSYLARWDAPGSSNPNYQIVRPVDALEQGALGGHFLQVAPVEYEGALYLFGSGDYRRSGVYLARLDSAELETGVGTALFDPAAGNFQEAAALSQEQREAVQPLFEQDGVGELSVSFIPEAGALIALYQRELRDEAGSIIDNRIVLRVAPAPEGPWSEPVTVIDMADPSFQQAHCCGETCPGDQLLHCDRAGLYGAYLLPAASFAPSENGGVLELPFIVSTWDPYNVVLFSTRIALARQ